MCIYTSIEWQENRIVVACVFASPFFVLLWTGSLKLSDETSTNLPTSLMQRVAKALTFAARGYKMSATKELGGAVFSEESVSMGKEFCNVVLVRNIEFYSTHEEDIMPFYGHAHIAYVPKSGQVIGLSKFARITEVSNWKPFFLSAVPIAFIHCIKRLFVDNTCLMCFDTINAALHEQ